MRGSSGLMKKTIFLKNQALAPSTPTPTLTILTQRLKARVVPWRERHGVGF